MPETDELAELVSGLSWSELREDVVLGAKKRVLDYLASALRGSTRAHAATLLAVVRELADSSRRGGCTLIGCDETAAAPWACLYNGTVGSSGPNLDDYWPGSYGHPGVGAVPAALAGAESCSASGADLLLAVVVGYEVATRVGSALGIEAFHRGWHPRGGCNTLAAAAAYLKSSGSNDATLYASAFGHAANSASGMVQGSYFFDTWYLLAGVAGLNGVLSARFARHGLTANRKMLDAKQQGNYLAMVSPSPVYDEIVGSPEDALHILDVPQKVYPATGSLHAAIEAALEIHAQAGGRIDAAASVHISGFRLLAEELSRPFPDNIVHGSMSVQFLVALALLRGRMDLESLTVGIDDESVRTLQEQTSVTLDEEIDAAAPGVLGARVEVELSDGTVYRAQVGPHKGTPVRPLSWEETVEKFMTVVGESVPASRRKRIIDVVARLDELSDLGELTELVRC